MEPPSDGRVAREAMERKRDSEGGFRPPRNRCGCRRSETGRNGGDATRRGDEVDDGSAGRNHVLMMGETWTRRRRWNSQTNLSHGMQAVGGAGMQVPVQYLQTYGNWQPYTYQPLQGAMQHSEALRTFMQQGGMMGLESAQLGPWNFTAQPTLQGQLDRGEQAPSLDLSLNLAVPRPTGVTQQTVPSYQRYNGMQGYNVSYNQQASPYQGLQLFGQPHQGLQYPPYSSARGAFVQPQVASNAPDSSYNVASAGTGMGGTQFEPLVGRAIGQQWRPIMPVLPSTGSQGMGRQAVPGITLDPEPDEHGLIHHRMESERRKKLCKRSPTQEMRALLRLFNAIFTQDSLVGRDLNRYTEEQIKSYLTRLGFSVGKFPVMTWGCPGGQYQGLAFVLSWILSAVHSKKGYVIVVSVEQAEEAVPYRAGSPYVADTAVLLEMGMLEYKWPFPLNWSMLTELRSVYDYRRGEAPSWKKPQVKEEDVMRVLGITYPPVFGLGSMGTGRVADSSPVGVEKDELASAEVLPTPAGELPGSTVDGDHDGTPADGSDVPCRAPETKEKCIDEETANGVTGEYPHPDKNAISTCIDFLNGPVNTVDTVLQASCAVQGSDSTVVAMASQGMSPGTSTGVGGLIASPTVPSVTPPAPAG